MGYQTSTVYGASDQEEPKVTIPISQYTEMVKQIQLLKDQAEIDRLKRELDAANDRNSELLCKLYRAEEKLKEVADGQ